MGNPMLRFGEEDAQVEAGENQNGLDPFPPGSGVPGQGATEIGIRVFFFSLSLSLSLSLVIRLWFLVLLGLEA